MGGGWKSGVDRSYAGSSFSAAIRSPVSERFGSRLPSDAYAHAPSRAKAFFHAGPAGMTAFRYFVASTFIRAFGTSPNISGAYIASTRLGGSAKSPTLFRRTVYSIFTTPLGRYS